MAAGGGQADPLMMMAMAQAAQQGGAMPPGAMPPGDPLAAMGGPPMGPPAGMPPMGPPPVDPMMAAGAPPMGPDPMMGGAPPMPPIPGAAPGAGAMPGMPSTDPATWLQLGAQITAQDQARVGDAAQQAMQTAAAQLGIEDPLNGPSPDLGMPGAAVGGVGGPMMGSIDGGIPAVAGPGGDALDAMGAY